VPLTSEDDPCVLAGWMRVKVNALAWFHVPADDRTVWRLSYDDTRRLLFAGLEEESRVKDTILVHKSLQLGFCEAPSKPQAADRPERRLRGLTFELTPTAEAGSVSLA
jgi:hypothetical protein